MSQDLASAINDGLFYYEQDLWSDLYEHGYDVTDEDEESWVSDTFFCAKFHSSFILS